MEDDFTKAWPFATIFHSLRSSESPNLDSFILLYIAICLFLLATTTFSRKNLRLEENTMATAACCNIHLRVETEQIKRASKPCKTRMQRSNLPLLSFSLPPLKWRKEIPLHIYYNYLLLSLLDLDSWLLSYISWSAPVHIINAPLRIARWLLDHVIIGILIMSSMLLWSIHGNLPLPVMLHAHVVDYGLH